MVVLGIKYWLALETRGKYDLDMKPLDSRDCDLAEAVKDKVLVTSGFRINTGQQISWWGTNSYFVLNIPGFDNPLNTLIQVKEMHGDFGRAKITVGFKVSTNNMTDITLRFPFLHTRSMQKILVIRWSMQTKSPGWSSWDADTLPRTFLLLAFLSLTG